MLQRLNRAESAATRALFACDHEGRGSARPAVVNVRAARLFADGVQLVALNDVESAVEGGLRTARGEIHTQPFWQARSAVGQCASRIFDDGEQRVGHRELDKC